jgi:hypothetical protein
MAVNLSPVGGVAAQFFTNTGAVLTGGKLFTYSAGTTTPVAAYTSSNGATAWTNPIVLDAAGRVSGSGEIWLTSGISYKFVLKDSNDVLIATYDNVTGINSNAVSFTNQQQIITATANQTVFNLSISYQVGTNSLSVFVDGVNQYGPGAQYAYTETDSDTVTFVSGLHVGAEVKFTTTQQQGAGAVDASQVSYTPAGTGAVTTNVQAKLRQYVSVKDFGAVGDGVTNDTAAIQAAENASGYIYWPAGTYVISSTISLAASKDRKWVGDGFNPQEIGTYIHGSIIKWAGAANGLMFNGQIAGGQNISGFVMQDLRVDGAGVASSAFAFASDVSHGQHFYWQNVQITGMAVSGTNAALDFYSASQNFSTVDSEFHGCIISGGARAIRIAGQQLNFFGGSIGAASTGILVALQSNSHPKFFGTGFYGGQSVFGIEGTTGIDGLECYGCWNEGNKGLFGRVGPTFSPAIGALRVIFSGQRSSCLSSGTRVIDTTGLQTNIIWQGGSNDNLGLAAVFIDTNSSMTVEQLQAGAFTYSGAGRVTEYRSTGVKVQLGNGLSDDLDFSTNVGVTGLNSVAARKNLVRMNSDDLCVVGAADALTKLSTGSSANFPAGAAKYDGVVGVDTTNGWLVFYVNGLRYKLVGTSY